MEQRPNHNEYGYPASVAYQNAMKAGGNGIEIDWLRLLKVILKKWWLILLLGVAIGALGYYQVNKSYTPVYTSTSSFVINATNPDVNYDNMNPATGSLSSMSQGRQLAGTFKEVLRSNTMLDKVAQHLGLGDRGGFIRGYMELEVVADTNILKMHITSTRPELSYDIANAIIAVYPEVINKTIKIGSLEVLDTPTMPGSANSFPQYTQKVALGALLGALLGVAIALALEMLRKTVKKSSDVQNALDMNLLAAVPLVLKPGTHKKKLPKGLLITDKSSGFTFVETYRSLRTKLETLSEKNGYKAVLVSSTAENEGKTTVAANLALTLAQNSKSVLLIDGDLRKPAIHKLLGISAQESGVGLIQYLKGNAQWKDCVRFVDTLGIFVLSSGGATSHSAEYLSSENMETLMATLKNEFDFIIIDSSPVSMVTDAAVIAGYCDAFVMVVKQDYARIADIARASEDLSSRGAAIAGCVFNVVEPSSLNSLNGYRRKYYKKNYYKNGYGYGYGYGYNDSGSDAEKKQ